MKKILAISLLLFGAAFLAGCTQQPANQTQPIMSAPETKMSAITNQAINEVANWKVYKNEKYGIEVKYPNDWFAPKEMKNPGLGIRYEYAIFFSGNPKIPYGEFNEGGIAIKIYKEADVRFTGEISNTADDYDNCFSKFISNISIGQGNYQAKEIYANRDVCFAETYFYSIQKGDYIYNIVPFPRGGNSYIGYDGKSKTEEYLPEFYKIVSTIRFTK